MNIARHVPRTEANFPLDATMNSMLNDLMGWNRGHRGGTVRMWAPDVDIAENTDNYLIHVELPGMKEEEVKITLNNNVLTIAGEKKQELREEKDKYVRTERTYGKFERSFSLPNNVKIDAVHADYHDGVLSITVPKAEESKAREIKIVKSAKVTFDHSP